MLFNLYLPARRRSIWLTLGSAEDGIALVSYDSNADTITIEYHGVHHALKMINARVVDSNAHQANGPTPGEGDLVPPRDIRNGLRNQSLTREEVAPHMDNDWFREFVRKYGPPVYVTKP